MNSRATDAQIDMIYELFDRLLTEGSLDLVDSLISHWSLGDDLDYLLAVLTVTLPAKSKLPSRVKFREAVVAVHGEGICEGL